MPRSYNLSGAELRFELQPDTARSNIDNFCCIHGTDSPTLSNCPWQSGNVYSLQLKKQKHLCYCFDGTELAICSHHFHRVLSTFLARAKQIQSTKGTLATARFTTCPGFLVYKLEAALYSLRNSFNKKRYIKMPLLLSLKLSNHKWNKLRWAFR